MKIIFRILIAILIIALVFAVIIGVCWLLGAAAHAIGILSWLLNGDRFDLVVMDGIMVLCLLGICGYLLVITVVIAEGLKI